MSRETYTPHFIMYVDKLTSTGPNGEHFFAECPELDLSAWGRTAINAEQNLGGKIRERLIEVMQKGL